MSCIFSSICTFHQLIMKIKKLNIDFSQLLEKLGAVDTSVFFWKIRLTPCVSDCDSVVLRMCSAGLCGKDIYISPVYDEKKNIDISLL